LKHAFIRRARKTAYLSDLIERYRRWKADHDSESDDSDSEM